ncbi:MAG TPA: STAS domain-containing protein [Acidimicrobiales bacterium]
MSSTGSHHDISVAEQPNGDAVVVVRGEIDVDALPALWASIDTARADGRRPLVIDMAGTTFLDSAGLYALVRAHQMQTEAEAPMTLRSPAPQVLDVLALAGVQDLFPIEPDGAGAGA